MWVALAVALVFAVLGQAVSGSAGLAVAYAVLLVLLVAYHFVVRGRSTDDAGSVPSHRRVEQ